MTDTKDATKEPQSVKGPRIKKGLVVINTGNGKGKTTAALGVLFRAWGRNMRVEMFQFLKHTGAIVRRKERGSQARHSDKGNGRRIHVALKGYGPHSGISAGAMGELQKGHPFRRTRRHYPRRIHLPAPLWLDPSGGRHRTR